MKILLRDARKGMFLKFGCVWTSDPEAAFKFRDPQELLDFVTKQRLKDVQAVMVFDNPRRYELVPMEFPDASPALPSIQPAAPVQQAGLAVRAA